MGRYYFILLIILCFAGQACSDSPNSESLGDFRIDNVRLDGMLSAQNIFVGVNPMSPIEIDFTEAVDQSTVNGNIQIKREGQSNPLDDLSISFPNGGKTIKIVPSPVFHTFSSYQLNILSNLKSSSGGKIYSGRGISFYTTIDSTDRFPRITDEKLLDLVQSQTFKYFWEGAHQGSGMARERSTANYTVTTGGTGFGVMAMVVASSRGFITRQEAKERVLKITDFLATKCTTYHGAFSHWIDGNTGQTQPFSEKDNGGDIIETSLLMQGLLTARQYFNSADESEVSLRAQITALWEAVEWDWYTKGENQLYWHWSPNYGWDMNMKVAGWNEALITYVLAASSPTHPISKAVYDNGWARNGGMKNGKDFYGIKLPLGYDFGGPMFLDHYSFLGINPKGLSDQYADYWTQVTAHAKIQYEYCKANPGKYYGYSADCWGLTASDGDQGYNAYSPTNDKGVIAPTAALASMPYTPKESMDALRFFYYKLGDKLWKDYGFVDAFNLSAKWYDDQFLAIDQGPIVIMIENYRSGLIWDTFMSCPEIKNGMKGLGFNSTYF